MNILTKLDALISLRPNAKFVYSDGEIIWNDEIETQPTELEINTKLTELQADYAWQKIRIKRNKLLAETDWTQFADSPLTAEQKYSYAEYRQQLRDLPASTSNPDDVVFPTKP